MKKLLSFIISCFMIIGMQTAFATTLTGECINGTLKIKHGSGHALLNIYDNNKLVGSHMAYSDRDEYSFGLSENEIASKLRLVYENGEMYDVSVAVPTPTTEPTPQPTKPPRPSVYEKAADAVHAPAVVQSVSETIIDAEKFYLLTLLYQGDEITTSVKDSIIINSAPSKDIQIIGKSVNSLKSGDIIHFLCDLQGSVRNIDLIYRPDFNDYIANNTVFNTLYGNDGYSQFHFGVPVSKTKASVTIADENGIIRDIDVDKNAFVYVVSETAKGVNSELYGTGAGAVDTAKIQSNNLDNIGNIISWEDVLDTPYILVRTVRNTATEVFVFE